MVASQTNLYDRETPTLSGVVRPSTILFLDKRNCRAVENSPIPQASYRNKKGRFEALATWKRQHPAK